MTAYDDRVWLTQYPPDRQTLRPTDTAVRTVLDAFADVVAARADQPAIHYFDTTLTAADLDRLSDAFAVALVDRGFAVGDRAVLYLQNVPQYVIAQLGIWKAGGIVVSANPMYRDRELAEIVADSGATVLVTLESLHRDVAASVAASHSIDTVITTSELEYRDASSGPRNTGEQLDMTTMIAAADGRRPDRARPNPDDVAVLTYTSGTTGPPKGAMTTHANLLFSACVYRDWIGIDASDVIGGIAPLFHVTGIVGHVGLSLVTGAPLVLTHRFDADDTVRAIARHGVTFTVGSITVFIALLNAAESSREKLASLTKIYSGGAPIPPATLTAFQDAFGHRIHNIYGLTETTSPAIAVPFGTTAPNDPASGTTAVGVPVFDTVVRVIGADGADLPVGEAGEIVIAGPQIVAGYWNKPDATTAALTAAGLRTGDVGFMNRDGWFFLVDRMKDQINASGFKVWPREVEDVLYEHPAVREAAVVGVPDDYRGETVRAFVSLRPGLETNAEELIAFAKERLAAYKAPRDVLVLDDIPKTASGKLLRRALRDEPID
ncbi:class I adenylate-forming enzyme family protein [Gordonia hydrophobica]|uniref:AMP-binding protein n=1 Tax=Gordonia hydrophobica TaxID=40516 RepID=A0ABZ2U5V9_9ACTN|nr:AMP-binding protein [Gordonia hydrophobica]MBM7369006.1 long-chain acyl-CoA synthetase [Gordonia hydrophobica]